MLRTSRDDSEAEYLSEVAQGAMRCFQCPPAFNSAHHGQHLGCGYVGDRSAAGPREDVTLKESNDAVAVARDPVRRVFSEPSRATTSKLFAVRSA
jgi:hypothetical protein